MHKAEEKSKIHSLLLMSMDCQKRIHWENIGRNILPGSINLKFKMPIGGLSIKFMDKPKFELKKAYIDLF